MACSAGVVWKMWNGSTRLRKKDKRTLLQMDWLKDKLYTNTLYTKVDEELSIKVLMRFC